MFLPFFPPPLLPTLSCRIFHTHTFHIKLCEIKNSTINISLIFWFPLGIMFPVSDLEDGSKSGGRGQSRIISPEHAAVLKSEGITDIKFPFLALLPTTC
jgi:hypothetical protein